MDTMRELLEARLEIEKQNRKIAELNALAQHYEELFRLSQRRLFGQSSEKAVFAGQINLWNADEAEKAPIEPEFEESVVKRKKRKGKREKDLAGLPVEVIDYELPESAQICRSCPTKSEQLINP